VSLLDRRRYVRHAAKGLLFVGSLLFSGCGQIMIRQSPCDPVHFTETTGGDTHEAWHESASVACPASCQNTDGGAVGSMKSGIGRCSEKIAECWYCSALAQWAANKRDQANAPPHPKFHPLPTHPALFPEADASQNDRLLLRKF